MIATQETLESASVPNKHLQKRGRRDHTSLPVILKSAKSMYFSEEMRLSERTFTTLWENDNDRS